jgi:hypothetical protein
MVIVSGNKAANAFAVSLSYNVATKEFATIVILIFVDTCAFIVKKELKHNTVAIINRCINFKI